MASPNEVPPEAQPTTHTGVPRIAQEKQFDLAKIAVKLK
jgi:hypothetical protein